VDYLTVTAAEQGDITYTMYNKSTFEIAPFTVNAADVLVQMCGALEYTVVANGALAPYIRASTTLSNALVIESDDREVL
jgi:hypothetical protein